jgi:hypothetical protein
MNRFATILILGLSVALSGCRSPEVRFTDMRPRPTGAVSGDRLTLHLGGDYYDSSTYVCPKFKFEGQTICVSGYRTLRQQKSDFEVQLPAAVNPQAVTVVWIDPDGSRMPVPITK